jgi:hypothetical protein
MDSFGKWDQIEHDLPGLSTKIWNSYAYCYKSINGIGLVLAQNDIIE